MKLSNIFGVLAGGASAGSILNHGKSHGDSLKAADDGDLQKIPLQSEATIFGMTVDRLWVRLS